MLNLLNYIAFISFNVFAMFDDYGYDEDSDNISWFLEGTKSKGFANKRQGYCHDHLTVTSIHCNALVDFGI